MAKESKAKSKGQKSIASFFGGGNSKDKKDAGRSTEEDAVSLSDEDVEMDDAPEPPKKDKSGAKASAIDTSDLPPIHDIPAIFSDLVNRIPQIKDVASRVAGRKIRVATMCSGTESPLLALEMIQNSIRDHYSVDLEVEHVFSCEIEPFKQAYIERNFHPPILFRDVCELGNDEAHTAYGALAPVPGNVDLLVAGTSCVDYSNLNNEKQDIDANGESGRTFRGMMSWVNRHRPPIVILENVCSAPWDRVKEKFEKHGYSADWSRVDTKFYYIPHTRTRVYLVAVDKKKSSIPQQWKDLVVNKLKRPASSTLDAFLLPSDDPRIHQARQKLVQASFNALDRRTGRTDWGRCESRHQRARLEEDLGAKRPLTSWDEGGSCKLPDFAWTDWGAGQVERVWDLMDISLLRDAKKGIDPSYKTQVWNLSQNVDRTIGSNKVGICPCLTPSMIPYITNRGGPMVGIEALSMQGLPVDKLLLTRESEDQLADLAGNAMSTTVVGTCILAALVTGKKLLKPGDATGESAADDVMEVDAPSSGVDDHIVGEDKLSYQPLDLSVTKSQTLAELLDSASKSARLCECEGRVEMTTRPLLRCQDCGTTACKKCAGRPEHNVLPVDLTANPRLPPSEFDARLKSTLPMCLSLSSVTAEHLDKLKANSGAKIDSERWSEWRDAVLRASGSELRFVELKRQDIWSAVYCSPVATLELSLHPRQPEWRLYAKPEDEVPANAEIRRVLEAPVGRLICKDELLDGQWDFALPEVTTVEVTLEGKGSLVPSWEARLGLTGKEFREKSVWSSIQISVPEPDVTRFDRDISGMYLLLDRCGTANNALHKQQLDGGSLPPLFMLLDPHRTRDSEDCFVFSISKRRYEYGESRPIIAKLDPSWRQHSGEGPQKVSCQLPLRWVRSEDVCLRATHGRDARFGVPNNAVEVSASNDSCKSAIALLACNVPLRGQAGPEWPKGTWGEVDKIHERSVFGSIAWLLERVRHADEHFSSWQSINACEDSNCERCAPTAPKVQYVQSRNNKIVAVEDPVQAGEYERRLKRRPSPFVTQLKVDGNGTGIVRVGINIPSLLHRALSRLPSEGRTEKPILSWKLSTNFVPKASLDLPKFTIMSNKLDKEHAQPPSFKLPLRTEQLRSLEWMIHQEDISAEPFVEEEVSEAILGPLGWRAEGRAQRAIHVRGGVLADQVGYGKTAITLGLIDCTWSNVEKEFSKKGRVDGKISLKATLVIVPPHLTRQWDSEVRKFTKKHFTTLVLSTVSNLNSATIEDFQSADIIIVASNIFKSNVYLENLSALAAVGPLPSKDGRHFNDHLRTVSSSLQTQTDRLQDEGPQAVKDEIQEGQKRVDREAVLAAQLQSKRLKGKSYRDAAEKTVADTKEGTKESEATVAPTKRTRMIMDGVVVPSYEGKGTKSTPELIPSSASSVPPSSVPPSETEGEDSDAPRKRKPRAAAPKVIVLSDDDDDTSTSEDEGAPQSKVSKKRVAASTAKSGRKTAQLKRLKQSDDDDSFAEESSDEDEEDAMSATSEEEQSKSKSKPKPKKLTKKKTARPTTSSTEDDMDVDKDAGKATKSTKKRKRDEDSQPAVKKQKRVDSDPWKLKSTGVRRDWTQMQAPPLEMFHFSRKVVDEYTYLDGKVLSLVTNLTADRQWVLSGTPPIHDFGALKTISAFLNIHLGIYDDAESQSAEARKRKREQTDVEKFHSFREVHSLEWHAHRHGVGQTFLDRFVRQNIAEIDEIPWTEKKVEIILPAAETAIYLELEHHLRALEMTVKRGKKTESDREKRVAKSLGESNSAEEALLKRCSHFDLETANENAMKACDVIVQERQKQLNECKGELLRAIKDGVKREQKLHNKGGESMFQEWARICRTEGVDDQDATEMVLSLIEEAGVSAGKAKLRKEDVNLSEKDKAEIWEHREKTHEIRRLTKELVGRIRSLRYFTVVRDLQKQRETPPVLSCPSCGRDQLNIEETAVLSSCGHVGCSACVRSCAEKEECVYASSGACKSAARVLNIVKAESLGVDDVERDGRGKHFGMKLEQVVKLIKAKIPKDDRILLFVQFPDLMKKVTEALAFNKIKFLEIKGSASQKSKNLEKFQNDSEERVLLLNVMDESASGANLTSANHAIFLSPLLAPSQEIYNACETQAIGRLVRYGQTKHVYVYRFLTKHTIDEEIYEQRTQKISSV